MPSPKINRVQPYIRERVLSKCWDYLDKNFEKLSTEQKIQIAIALCKQSMPNINQNTDEVIIKVQHQDLEDRVACYCKN